MTSPLLVGACRFNPTCNLKSLLFAPLIKKGGKYERKLILLYTHLMEKIMFEILSHVYICLAYVGVGGPCALLGVLWDLLVPHRP